MITILLLVTEIKLLYFWIFFLKEDTNVWFSSVHGQAYFHFNKFQWEIIQTVRGEYALAFATFIL